MLRGEIENKRRCKAIRKEGGRCRLPIFLDGYCVKHYKGNYKVHKR